MLRMKLFLRSLRRERNSQYHVVTSAIVLLFVWSVVRITLCHRQMPCLDEMFYEFTWFKLWAFPLWGTFFVQWYTEFYLEYVREDDEKPQEVIKGGRNLTVLMLGIKKQFSTQTGEMQRFKWQNVTREVGRTRFKKAVKKIKNLLHEQRCGLRNWTETFRLQFDWIQEVAC